MKIILTVLSICSIIASVGWAYPVNFQTSWQTATNHDVFHSGGCRKSSPVGQCCHMQKSTGQVHCH